MERFCRSGSAKRGARKSTKWCWRSGAFRSVTQLRRFDAAVVAVTPSFGPVTKSWARETDAREAVAPQGSRNRAERTGRSPGAKAWPSAGVDTATARSTAGAPGEGTQLPREETPLQTQVVLSISP